MSTLRVSNIEAKADASSPSVNEKIKITNSNGDVQLTINGETAGITTVGVNTTGKTFDVNTDQKVSFVGDIITSGSVGIGTDNPLTKTHIDGTNGDNSTLFIAASDLDANYGGTISLGGNYDGTNKTAFSQIKGLKDNNTSGEYGGYLSFLTRTNGQSATERLRIDSSGHVLPAANNTYDLGSTTLGWRNVYMNDMNLSNMNGDTNDVDGTQGSWTIQEGKDDLYIINRLNGKKFKIKMEEIS